MANNPHQVAYILHREEHGWRAEAHAPQDPVLSAVGYGDKQEEAVENLKSQPQFQQLLQRCGRAAPDMSDFTVDVRSEREMTENAKREYGYIAAGPNRSIEEPQSLEPRNIKPRRAKPVTQAREAKLPPQANRRKPPQAKE